MREGEEKRVKQEGRSVGFWPRRWCHRFSTVTLLSGVCVWRCVWRMTAALSHLINSHLVYSSSLQFSPSFHPSIDPLSPLHLFSPRSSTSAASCHRPHISFLKVMWKVAGSWEKQNDLYDPVTPSCYPGSACSKTFTNHADPILWKPLRAGQVVWYTESTILKWFM